MYEFREVGTDQEGIAACTRLLRTVFPGALQYTDRYVDWEYRLNPSGQIVGFNAWQGDVLAAHYVAQPLLAQVDGRHERGLLSLNTATHPEHQGKKLFTSLASRTYELAASRGYGFVAGVANANSTHGFVERLGFQLVGPLGARIGMGGIRYVTPSATAGSFERIWNRELLAWRLANPEAKYTVRGGEVLAATGKFGIKAALGAFEPSLLRDLTGRSARGIGLKVWMGLDRDIRWRGSLFVDIPLRFRPSPLNLIFLDLTGKSRKIALDGTRFRALDFDAF